MRLGRGFGAGLLQGQQGAQRGIDMYKQAALESDLGDAWKAGQENAYSWDPEAAPNDNGEIPTQTSYKLGDRTQDKPFTKDDVTRERANRAADVYAKHGKPEEGFKLRAASKHDALLDVQGEQAGLQLRETKRTAARNQMSDQAMDIARQFAMKVLPEDEAIRRLAALHGPHPDGHQAAVVNVGGQPHAVVMNEATRTGESYPITGDGTTFNKAWGQFMSLMSPEAYDRERNFGLKERETKAHERGAAAHETTAQAALKKAGTDEQYRLNQVPVLNAQSRMYDAHANYYNRERSHNATGPAARFQMMQDEVKAYSQALISAGHAKTPEQATRMAWSAILKDPNARQMAQEDPIEAAMIRNIKTNDDVKEVEAYRARRDREKRLNNTAGPGDEQGGGGLGGLLPGNPGGGETDLETPAPAPTWWERGRAAMQPGYAPQGDAYSPFQGLRAPQRMRGNSVY